MTKEQFFNKFNELIQENIESQLHIKANTVLRSGSVDLNDYDDDYRLPKLVLVAALRSISHDFAPFYEDGKKVLKKLETII